MRRFFVYSIGLPICMTVLASITIPGCSGGDSAVVAEGEPAVRRKDKDDALNKLVNPNNTPVTPPKGKSRSAKSETKVAPPPSSL